MSDSKALTGKSNQEIFKQIVLIAEKIVLVVDKLNTHRPACFYERFPTEEAARLARKFEWHYTPTHGSWLNMTECELSLLSR